MGTEWSTRIDGKEYKPQTISAMILMQLKNDIHTLQKLLTRFRVDKAAEQDVENIRQAKEKLERTAGDLIQK